MVAGWAAGSYFAARRCRQVVACGRSTRSHVFNYTGEGLHFAVHFQFFVGLEYDLVHVIIFTNTDFCYSVHSRILIDLSTGGDLCYTFHMLF